mmetsp:Transcript_13139/g.32752  ORF Transcript_13139/g.32752 Transcript_13139/m.32752 type:complete len:211 (-) Transcript_13139:356-988(-)
MLFVQNLIRRFDLALRDSNLRSIRRSAENTNRTHERLLLELSGVGSTPIATHVVLKAVQVLHDEQIWIRPSHGIMPTRLITGIVCVAIRGDRIINLEYRRRWSRGGGCCGFRSTGTCFVETICDANASLLPEAAQERDGGSSCISIVRREKSLLVFELLRCSHVWLQSERRWRRSGMRRCLLGNVVATCPPPARRALVCLACASDERKWR